MRPLAFVTATAALLAGPTGQPAAAAEPVVTKLALSGDRFRMTDTRTVSEATTLDGKPADADLADVVTTDFTTDSSGASAPWTNLRTMGACAGDDTTPRWWPQGMSGTGTADGADGAIQDKRVTAVAWHYETFKTNAAGDYEANDKCRTNNLLKLTLVDRDTKKCGDLVGPPSGGRGR
ncbi:hypothetical protein [Streptomyces phaeolivaceus]|uniref:hypothetical protein n=1 Tax=Streptomyces phaeolivaceus TaxID=2653200 RepID=UPI00186A6724|nr:hypothetical protein [Streptomyces phaeolivaceus]